MIINTSDRVFQYTIILYRDSGSNPLALPLSQLVATRVHLAYCITVAICTLCFLAIKFGSFFTGDDYIIFTVHVLIRKWNLPPEDCIVLYVSLSGSKKWNTLTFWILLPLLLQGLFVWVNNCNYYRVLASY